MRNNKAGFSIISIVAAIIIIEQWHNRVYAQSIHKVIHVKWVHASIYMALLLFFAIIILGLIARLRRKRKNEYMLNEHMEAFVYMAYHDGATGLYNRNYMIEYLNEQLLKNDIVMTALYNISICNFRIINDTYGHDVGTKVLEHIGDVLGKTLISENELVSSYHGEFLISDGEIISSEFAVEKARHLRSLLEKTIEVDRMAIEIRINIGIAISPDHTLDGGELIKKANMALVEAVKDGPSTIKMFEDTFYRDIIKRITLEKQLRRALSLNEFVLHFQPKIDLTHMRVGGCEALIRWNHPDGEVVYPNSFIPLAEEVGMIEEIDRWVVKQSVHQVKIWAQQGYDICLSVNVSGREFDDEFIEFIEDVITKEAVDPRLLDIEITETAALRDVEHSQQLVKRLCDAGFTVSLDDFGTGYSSMIYIKQLKATKLKIDKTFIDHLEHYEHWAVVDSMIQLGKKLDYLINVEGVETIEQLKTLKELEVDEVQGWLFSKALPPDEFIKYVDELCMDLDEK